METRIGISGWRYEPWRDSFYPPRLPQKRELEFASRMVNAIEINGTFYSLQTPARFQLWYQATPDDFKFSVKGPRYITHIRRLKEVEAPLGNFFASGVLHLRDKLGPFLWQFPPNFPFYQERFEDFFGLLPRTAGEAIKLMDKADRLEVDFPSELAKSTKLRHAIEVRHDSFMNPEFIELLRSQDIALVSADTAGLWPYMEDMTSDFVYLRLHGSEKLYASGYSDELLDWWAARLTVWQRGSEPKDALTIGEPSAKTKGRDAYIFFDNDVKVHAPFNAQSLLRKLTRFRSPDPKNWQAWIPS